MREAVKPYALGALLLMSLVVAFMGIHSSHSTPLPPHAYPPVVSETTPKQSDKPVTYDSIFATQPTPLASSIVPTTPISQYEQIKKTVAQEFIYKTLDDATPNDPGYKDNWPLQKIGAPAAWKATTTASPTIIAVVDSGFALDHEDLASQWHLNTDETGSTKPGERCWTGAPADKQTNDCDDDGNTYIDDWRGWNFAINDNLPQTGRQRADGPGVRHGTEVAGFAGAASNNGTGSTALNPQAKIMPLQVLNDDGVGYTSAVAAAIYYAADNGADVINMSLGTASDDKTVQQAIGYAVNKGSILVAAAGNCGDGGDECKDMPAGTTIAYPARNPDVIAVGASTPADLPAEFSSSGEALDVVAPGYSLPIAPSWSPTNPTASYSTSLNGTSFAAPQVASLAALIRATRTDSSTHDITALIAATAHKPSSMKGMFYTPHHGHGVINAPAAVRMAQKVNEKPVAPDLSQDGKEAEITQPEEVKPLNSWVKSSCEAAAGAACTVQIASKTSGHTRYLPYRSLPHDGEADWSWSTSSLSADSWHIRARSGDMVSPTPYPLAVKD